MRRLDFAKRLKTACGVEHGDHVLAAVSGGADSTALLGLLVQVREEMALTVSCAHVEHGIRGAQSVADMDFVRDLCRQWNVPFYAERVDVPSYAKAYGCGTEEAARILRYQALERIAQQIGANEIALAHHAGDQAETVLLHAMRGSDIRGLGAMRFRRGHLIRPLLDQNPQGLREMLAQWHQPFCEDETNADRAYTRNRVRLDVLPCMEKAVPGAGKALCRLAQAAQRDEDFFQNQVEQLHLTQYALVDGIAVPKAELQALHPALCSRALVRLIQKAGLPAQSAETTSALCDELMQESGTVNLSAGGHAVIGETYLCVVRSETPTIRVPLRVPGITQTPFGCFEVRPAQAGETGDGKTSQRIPMSYLKQAWVGGRTEGETMVPFGRKTPVKIKKLMIDAGVERAMRDSVPLVHAGETVLWAVGLRAAACCGEEGETMLVHFKGDCPWQKPRHLYSPYSSYSP